METLSNFVVLVKALWPVLLVMALVFGAAGIAERVTR